MKQENVYHLFPYQFIISKLTLQIKKHVHFISMYGNYMYYLNIIHIVSDEGFSQLKLVYL